ncbi:hypothetical protein FOZ63_017621 [Perkinsus olseni]|uniref:Uncharacterized protein n=1 Tax=Perkinsus olseni TaxID=32597 RepID=A0A7J6NCX1_PEROL|nr:hypothetical protein FOZ60_011720 [Perkinsus olseni]KAF4728392.1 hypothetical protein FOZ62_017449 [Perkinsus olseni]KAF4748372.1 hypothetical protein FOZ63_017621 [Perkinsus olseni]
MESSGRRSVSVGRSICADLNLWKVRIESLQCVVLPLPLDAPVVSGSDASTKGLGGWVSVPSEGRPSSVFFFQCGLQDIPSGILEFLVEDPAAGACPSDMACLEMLAMCLGFCLALSKAGSSHSLVLLCDNEPAVRALRKCYSSAPRTSLLLRQMALVLADSPFPIPYRVRSVKGVKNLAADVLSRSFPCTSVPPEWVSVDTGPLFQQLMPS